MRSSFSTNRSLRLLFCVAVFSISSAACLPTARGADDATAARLEKIGTQRGVCVVLGLPEDGKADAVVALAKASELTLYVQSASAEEVTAMRAAAEQAGLLGTRIYVDQGPWSRIQVANNIADAVLVEASARKGGVDRAELLRVLHPGARAFVGAEPITKPIPKGLQSWSHPYHSADNNPNSSDQVARYPYLTQFLATPMFGCISEVTVGSNGRIFKAFGHRAFHKIQNEVLNTLYGINGYNGTILWKRDLKKGFMIHRNTMVATPDVLYLADDESCKLIDTRTGKLKGEIKPPADQVGGTTWKWMALEDGVLYALIGGPELKIPVTPGKGSGLGHWPWGMWPGYDYKNPKTAFGSGRHLLAFDVESKKILWKHVSKEYYDGRAVCMKGGRIYAYSPDKKLVCLDAKSGKPIWSTSKSDVVKAIGKNGRAQGYIRGFATTCYMKVSDDYIFFSGPQRDRLSVVSAKDGSFAWKFGNGNFQLVLRDDALYAFGGQRARSYRLEYATGKVLSQWSGRRACTRATGSIDSMFCRASGGTLRYSASSHAIEHIAPMRPPCHDGVVISDGLLYWGPWVCACQLSLFGHIALGPAGDFDFHAKPLEKDRLQTGQGDITKVKPLGDLKLQFKIGEDGVLRAINKANGKPLWKAYTGGEINYQPMQEDGRVFVGSNDGRVYAFEAATGRLLWRYRAAPQVRRIPVYGRLASTWPVAGGVVVRNGTVYAAAGIAHYDGTHVYALDAITGKLKWHNGDSGQLNAKLKNGVSLCGPLAIGRTRQGQEVLQFAGGNAVAQGWYDLATGKCLTPPPTAPQGVSKSTFYVEKYLKRKAQK